MATGPSTVEYILDQLVDLRAITVKKMFGEYALYKEGKVVGLICSDTLFIKRTVGGQKYLGNDYIEGIACPGAKPSIQIDSEKIEDHVWLSKLIQITFDELPEPKKRKAINY
ncbi:TfoX/Sxy family protein [Patescibacteria group bacterium]|nr:TfoX/Sxy family protein [Patescibacteria group bacterium]